MYGTTSSAKGKIWRAPNIWKFRFFCKRSANTIALRLQPVANTLLLGHRVKTFRVVSYIQESWRLSICKGICNSRITSVYRTKCKKIHVWRISTYCASHLLSERITWEPYLTRPEGQMAHIHPSPKRMCTLWPPRLSTNKKIEPIINYTVLWHL